MLTVCCVLRSGGRYDASWVGKLQHGVAKHLPREHRFVCLSDVDVPCERIPLETDWPGWWSKANLWSPSAGLTGPTLYFDLDTLIVSDLSRMADHPHRFTMAHEFYRPKFKCSTAMAWIGDFSAIWRAMQTDPEGIMHRYDVQREDRRIGDQALIEDVLQANGVPVATFRDLFGETSVASYKVHAKSKIPAGSMAVAFHGQPKMNEAGGWAQKMWEAL